VAGRGVVTGEAVGAVAADGVEGGNDFKVGEGAPSSAPKLHMSDTDIRPCLTGDEKQELTDDGGSRPHDPRRRLG
jgi:hypothetical protein